MNRNKRETDPVSVIFGSNQFFFFDTLDETSPLPPRGGMMCDG